MTTTKCEYEDQYLFADTSFVINDLDPDRKIIRISLPKPPPIDTIDGYGLPASEQCFRRKELPKKLALLEEEVLKELQNIKKQNRQETVTGYKIIENFWERLEAQSDEDEEEIEWIKHIWWYRINGYWFFDDGKPTYISGRHFMFLTLYQSPQIETKDHYPEYRDRHRREYLFRDYLRVAHHTFAKRDEKGWAIPEEDGHYEMIDIGMRLFFGVIHPKSRRNGSTLMALNNMIEGSERGFGRYSTFISKDGDSTEDHYKLRLIPQWGNRPVFIKPIWNGTSSPEQINYYSPKNNYGIETLNSTIGYTNSAGVLKKDGSMFNGFIGFDEEGKCFSGLTPILIYGGGSKLAKDIIIGDIIVGDDGNPRKVLSLTQGKGQLYKVIPKKGEPWICNGEHVLVTKNCDSFIGHKFGDVIEISVKNYLALSKYNKRSLVLYRTGVSYTENKHDISPYLLGLWLGDGTHTAAVIHNIDKEVIDFLYSYSAERGWHVYRDKRRGISYTLQSPRWYEYEDKTGQLSVFKYKAEIMRKFGLYAEKLAHLKPQGGKSFFQQLKEISVIGDKHIPTSFLYDSRENRLNLLAGLLDTDGYAYKLPRLMYEIIQVKKDLAYQVYNLALSLGFYASINFKKTSYKLNGEQHLCDGGYRIKIHGKNLYEIPCKIKRKKYDKRELHINTREPLHTGFKVETDEIGDYYGFSVEGNGRFLLADHTVVHNCDQVEVNVLQRWDNYKNAMSLGDGSIILGECSHDSTVEEINASGKAFLDMLDLSEFYCRGENGQTSSGLAAMVFPAYDGLEGFIDFFGMSVIHDPTEIQLAMRPDAQFAVFKKGSYEYQMGKRADFLKKGTPAAMQSYRAYVKKYPHRSNELTIGTSGDMGFDYEIVDKRMAELRKLNALGKLPVKIGNFYRQDNHPEGLVYWKTEEHGKFEISMEIEPNQTNLKKRSMGWDVNQNKYVSQYEPVYKSRFTLGADPVEYSNKKEDSGASKQSDPAITVKWEHDATIDKSDNPADWVSDNCILYYRYRPQSLQEYCEDVLMAAEFIGAMIYPENNKTRLFEYIIERGRGGYLKYDLDPRTGKIAEKPGYYATNSSKNDGFGEVKDWIAYHAHKCNHLKLLEEIRNIRTMDELTKYDGLAAWIANLMGSRSPYGKVFDQVNSQKVDLGKCSWLNH